MYQFVTIVLSLAFSASANIVGSYVTTSSPNGLGASCSSGSQLILGESGTLVRGNCTGPYSDMMVEFGIWRQTSDSSVQEFLSDGPFRAVEVEYGKTLNYGGEPLKKVSPSSLTINKVASMFGQWKAPSDQSNEDCSVASKLDIKENGQILRYYCKGTQKGWFEKGFFKIASLKDQDVIISSIYNGTSVTSAITVSEDSSKLTFNHKVTLSRE